MTGPPRVALLAQARTYRMAAFLTAASRLGLEAVQGIEMHPNLADFWRAPLPLEFHDLEASVARIVAFARDHPLRAVIAVDDSAAILAAAAGQALGLPHNDPEAALAARDKHRMRSRLHAAGLPVPAFRAYPLSADFRVAAREAPYPCVIKPTRLSGSRGVIRADNPEEFAAAFQRTAGIATASAAAAPELLVEEFIPGTEVALEGLLVDGRLRALALFDKPDPLDGPYFEETIYVTPSRLPAAVQRAVTLTAERAAAGLGLRHGPVHAELRVNDRGPWIVEVAGRSIGGLCSRTLRFKGGVSLEELILRQACGLPLEPTRQTGAAGVMMIPIPGPGVLRGVGGIEAARGVAGVEDVVITAACGYPVVPLPEGESYLGFIFAAARKPDDVEAALRAAHGRLVVEITPEIPVLPAPLR